MPPLPDFISIFLAWFGKKAYSNWRRSFTVLSQWLSMCGPKNGSDLGTWKIGTLRGPIQITSEVVRRKTINFCLNKPCDDELLLPFDHSEMYNSLLSPIALQCHSMIQHISLPWTVFWYSFLLSQHLTLSPWIWCRPQLEIHTIGMVRYTTKHGKYPG